MIKIAEQDDITDINNKLLAICRHLNIKLLPVANTQGVGYKVVTHWPFECRNNFPPEPLNNPKNNGTKC
jgi:hypothetical protein